MSKSVSASETKKKSSLDYPLLAKKLIEASGDAGISKLPAGLYIVATPIGHLGDITMRGLITLLSADLIACEDTRTSGAMLSKFGIKQKLISYHDHNADGRRPELLAHLNEGKAVALISDAGMPLIADPGYKLVHACREEGIDVFVIPGPSAAITALAGSGLPTDHFYFAGFLPSKSTGRKKALAGLSVVPATLVFYEAPQRLKETLRDMAEILGPVRKAAIARELTKLFEETKCGKLGELSEFYLDHDVKGEIVIVVEPPAEAVATEQDLDDVLRTYLRSMSVRDASAAACAVTGISKSEVYARALWLAGKNSG
ncbi:MAG: 16S rRNA (cytidine(1402)-2'-O)-methyltransferase [Alphaproteobacteria bacterium]